jgi:hypothetical protein
MMNLYLFDGIDQLTDRWHSGGSLVVVARDKEHVLELLKQYPHVSIEESEWDSVIVYKVPKSSQPRVFIFQDAGCC